MAVIGKAFYNLMRDEGKWLVDSDGQTYKGICRKYWPNWEGWKIIDSTIELNLPDFPAILETLPELQVKVLEFYKENFFDPIRFEDIKLQSVAESIFNFAVNDGVKTTVKMVQSVLEVKQDGIFGPITLETLNSISKQMFLLIFFKMKIRHRADICNKNKSKTKNLLGWINRDLKY